MPVDSPEILALFHSELDLVDLLARQTARALGGTVELDELRSFGLHGLLDAARRFEPARGVPFRRFANFRVRGAMFDGMRRSSQLPRRVYARLRALEASLFVAESDDPGHSESPRAADAKLSSHLADMVTAMTLGLVHPRGTGDDGEAVSVDPSASPEELVADAELRSLLKQAIDQLPEDERALVRGHYLLGGRFDEVAASLGMSKSWGSRLHTRAIARLTKRLRGLHR